MRVLEGGWGGVSEGWGGEWKEEAGLDGVELDVLGRAGGLVVREDESVMK